MFIISYLWKENNNSIKSNEKNELFLKNIFKYYKKSLVICNMMFICLLIYELYNMYDNHDKSNINIDNNNTDNTYTFWYIFDDSLIYLIFEFLEGIFSVFNLLASFSGE